MSRPFLGGRNDRNILSDNRSRSQENRRHRHFRLDDRDFVAQIQFVIFLDCFSFLMRWGIALFISDSGYVFRAFNIRSNGSRISWKPLLEFSCAEASSTIKVEPKIHGDERFERYRVSLGT